MKQIFTFLAFCCLTVAGWSQTSAEKNNNWAWLRITPVMGQQSEQLSESLSNIVLSKMGQMLNANKVGSVSKNAPFNMVATLVVNQTDVTRTTPAKYSVGCSLTLQILDARNGDVYGEITRDLRGIGSGKDNAVKSALTGINARAPYFKVFIDGAKNKIKENYQPQSPSASSNDTSVTPVNDMPVAVEANDEQPSNKYEIRMSKSIVVEYLGAERYGERLYLHFAFTSSKGEDIRVEQMTIFDREGTPYRETGRGVGNNKVDMNYFDRRLSLMPNVRTMIKCVFPAVDVVSACQFSYEDNTYRFTELPLVAPAD